ncbi:MAG TPA: murein biosynthesis integral membrane protein MurJ [Beijerinckiaceae bacterium]|jgi:putative peptidoglycan lipid II flippase
MSLARSTALVGLAAAASRVLGFARDVLIARALGAGPAADAFLIAFRIPSLARRVLGEGGLNAGFVPLYARLKGEAGPEAAARFAGKAFSGLALVLLAVVALIEVAAGGAVLALAAGYRDDPEIFALAARCTRLAFPFVFSVALAALLSALLNAERRFAAAALAPVAVNALLIAALLVLQASGLTPERQAQWLAAAVSLSGLLHLATVAAAVRRAGLPIRLGRPRLTPTVRRLLFAGAPAVAASGAAQLMIVAATEVASFTPSAVSWLYYADRIFQLPLGFVGSGVGLVLLPDIAARLDHDRDGVAAAQNRALEAALLLTMPAAVALLVLARPIAQVLFERGAFTAQDTAGTAAALMGLAIGLPFAVAGKVLTQPLFALEKLRPALLALALGLIITVVAGFALSAPFGVLGVALGASLGFAVHAGIVAAALKAAGLWRPDARLRRRFLATVAASAVMGAGLAAANGALPDLSTISAIARAGLLAALCLGGLVLYAAAAFAFRAAARGDLAAFCRPARACASEKALP